MKIAVSSSGETIDHPVDIRFGRAPYFIIVDGDEVEVIKNENIHGAGGVGITTAQMIAEKNVEVVISGNFGPKAFNVLSSAGIKMYSTSGETVSEALESFKKGELKQIDDIYKAPRRFGKGMRGL
ncbi:MAG: hypothetical protein DRH44_04650 [Candidatus Coatesbacteria bacterium]|nr:MAG: hypothetical protein DRH49_04460 [Candidatus Coatesbacteria bacterium]RLC43578.1 MAG: hypothetical protein DRH44_04650 [Candidatus Coatesbacteria bacterium]